MYNYSVILLKKEYSQDEYGNVISTETQTEVLCDIRSLTRNEYYSAQQAGLRPSFVLLLNGFEYNGENEAIFKGEHYTLTRIFQTDFETIELTATRKAKDEHTN